MADHWLCCCNPYPYYPYYGPGGSGAFCDCCGHDSVVVMIQGVTYIQNTLLLSACPTCPTAWGIKWTDVNGHSLQLQNCYSLCSANAVENWYKGCAAIPVTLDAGGLIRGGARCLYAATLYLAAKVTCLAGRETGKRQVTLQWTYGLHLDGCSTGIDNDCAATLAGISCSTTPHPDGPTCTPGTSSVGDTLVEGSICTTGCGGSLTFSRDPTADGIYQATVFF